MISFETALKKILDSAVKLPAENVLIEDSAGRILKEDIYSDISMPPFDKSAMDGFALNSKDARVIPVKLKCVGLIQAGEAFGKDIKRGECVKIMTGAPLPKGTDSVVMVENTRVDAVGIEILNPVREGDNVCFKGEDIQPGQRIFKKEKEISPSDVAIFATVGRKLVKVNGIPKVAILNTGGEIVQAGSKLGKNKIYNSNGPMLAGLLKSEGIIPSVLGAVKDDAKALRDALRKALDMDVVLVSGGVSMGDYDLVPDVLINMGVKRVFHKVNIKPGKPLFFGVKDKTLIFGIPGNPVSNFLAFLVFILPALRKLMGYKDCKPLFREGIAESGFNSKTGRRHFVLVKVSRKSDSFYLSPVDSHGSADTLSLSKADGFMMVDEKSGAIKKNSKARFITWKVK